MIMGADSRLHPDDDELEAQIRALIEAKNAAEVDSAEHCMIVRQLAGLRYTREEAGPIMEDMDPYGFGATQPNPPAEDPEGQLLPLRRLNYPATTKGE